jgi:presenilin-like A22 family membrane protease
LGLQVDQRKRFFVAMAFYAVLALLVWFVMDSSSVAVGSGQVSIRGLTFVLLAFFAGRTILHWNAERIRAQKESQQQ